MHIGRRSMDVTERSLAPMDRQDGHLLDIFAHVRNTCKC